jgi:ubiquinone/menaquinone biosynthesis C-methylase UbiE
MSLITHLFGRSVFPARYAWFLEGRWRQLILSPDQLQRRLPLSPEMTVLEIGVGGGYYAGPLSQFVHRFIGLDLQAEMLKRLRQRCPDGRVIPVHGDALHLPLADGVIDIVIAVTVLGEVPSAEGAIAEAHRVLRPGGFLSISEHWPDPDFLAFPQVDALCRKSGLQLQTRYGGRRNYTAIFRAPNSA